MSAAVAFGVPCDIADSGSERPGPSAQPGQPRREDLGRHRLPEGHDADAADRPRVEPAAGAVRREIGERHLHGLPHGYGGEGGAPRLPGQGHVRRAQVQAVAAAAALATGGATGDVTEDDQLWICD